MRPNKPSDLDILAEPKSKNFLNRKQKAYYELRRFHPHMVKPFVNDNVSMKVFTHSNLTLSILGTCFLVGYCYARLEKDEYLRRTMYTRYSNFML